jgi:hypothetical protein
MPGQYRSNYSTVALGSSSSPASHIASAIMMMKMIVASPVNSRAVKHSVYLNAE